MDAAERAAKLAYLAQLAARAFGSASAADRALWRFERRRLVAELAAADDAEPPAADREARVR